MPELPEVETIRRDLAGALVGRRIEDVVVSGARTVRRSSASAVVEGLRARRVVEAGRRGKYLLLSTDSQAVAVIHLRMSGQLRLEPAMAPRPKHTHVALALEGGDELRFVDPRTFGEVVVVESGRWAEQAPDVVGLGPDAWDDLMSAAALASVVRSRSRQLKSMLTDQRTVAGLGNIYTDEVLHRARLAPWRVSSTLDDAEVARLHRSLRAVLGEAIAARGSTLGDNQYVDLWGRAGVFQLRHRVYARAGLPCRRCRAPIERERRAGRSTAWCPACQT